MVQKPKHLEAENEDGETNLKKLICNKKIIPRFRKEGWIIQSPKNRNDDVEN